MNQYQLHDYSIRPYDLYNQAKYDFILASLLKKPRAKVLHIGAATGEFSQKIVQMGYEVTDLDPVYETLPINSNTLNKIAQKIEDFSTSDTYDFIISSDVLEHIENDQRALHNSLLFLKPKGVAIHIVPALPSLYGYHDKQLGHYRRYTKETFLQLIPPEYSAQTHYFGLLFIPIVFCYSKILKRMYPVQQTFQNPLTRSIMKLMLHIESKIKPSVGTALIVVIHKKNAIS